MKETRQKDGLVLTEIVFFVMTKPYKIVELKKFNTIQVPNVV